MSEVSTPVAPCVHTCGPLCPHLCPPALPFDPVTHLAMMSPVQSATVTASLLAGEETRREDTEPEVDMDRGLVDINAEEERQCFLYQG